MKTCLFFTILALLAASILLTACTIPSGPCTYTANVPVTAYRLPDDTSDVFGTVSSGDTYEILAWTAEGWVGFDPGVAQAGNIGLAHHRWIRLNVSLSSSCLASVDLVTLDDVLADLAASGQ